MAGGGQGVGGGWGGGEVGTERTYLRHVWGGTRARCSTDALGGAPLAVFARENPRLTVHVSGGILRGGVVAPRRAAVACFSLATLPHVATTASGANAAWLINAGPHTSAVTTAIGGRLVLAERGCVKRLLVCSSSAWTFTPISILCLAALPHHGSSGDGTTTVTGHGADGRGVHRTTAPALFPTWRNVRVLA